MEHIALSGSNSSIEPHRVPDGNGARPTLLKSGLRPITQPKAVEIPARMEEGAVPLPERLLPLFSRCRSASTQPETAIERLDDAAFAGAVIQEVRQRIDTGPRNVRVFRQIGGGVHPGGG